MICTLSNKKFNFKFWIYTSLTNTGMKEKSLPQMSCDVIPLENAYGGKTKSHSKIFHSFLVTYLFLLIQKKNIPTNTKLSNVQHKQTELCATHVHTYTFHLGGLQRILNM